MNINKLLLFSLVLGIVVAADGTDDNVNIIRDEDGEDVKICFDHENCDCNRFWEVTPTSYEFNELPSGTSCAVSDHPDGWCITFLPDDGLFWYCVRSMVKIYITFEVKESYLSEFQESEDEQVAQLAHTLGVSVDQISYRTVSVVDDSVRRRFLQGSSTTHPFLHDFYYDEFGTYSPTEATGDWYDAPDGYAKTIQEIAIDYPAQKQSVFYGYATDNGTQSSYHTHLMENLNTVDQNGESLFTLMAISEIDPCTELPFDKECVLISDPAIIATDAPVDMGVPAEQFYPSVSPTDPNAQSFGDPIIWTFHGECYDLNVDGRYLASTHETSYDHEVYISVYNHYMRDIQVVHKHTGELMLSINNFGEVINNNYPYYFKKEMKKCESGRECLFFYEQYTFDAQQFEFIIQIQPHAYEDPALKGDGDWGVHLDIYPDPYDGFKASDYHGLYFENPIPFTSGECNPY